MAEFEYIDVDLASRGKHITTVDWYSGPLTIFLTESGQRIGRVTQGDVTVWNRSQDGEYAQFLFLYEQPPTLSKSRRLSHELYQGNDATTVEKPPKVLGDDGYLERTTKGSLEEGHPKSSREKIDAVGSPDSSQGVERSSDEHGKVVTTALQKGLNRSYGESRPQSKDSGATTAGPTTLHHGHTEHTGVTYDKDHSVKRNIQDILLLELAIMEADLKPRRLYFYNEAGEWTKTDRVTFNLKMYGLKLSNRGSSEGSLEPNVSQFRRPEKPPPFFGIDVDGTFYTENKESWKKNVESFINARKRGYTPFLCTGRTVEGSTQTLSSFFSETDYKGYPGVYGNGTLVYDENGKIIYYSYFSRAFMSQILQRINNIGYRAKVIFEDYQHYYSLEYAPFILSRMFLFYEHFEPIIIDEEALLDCKICKVSLFDCDLDLEDLSTEYSKKEVSFGVFYDLTPSSVTKAHGVMKLMEHFNVPPEDCAFIGDGDNDVDIMKLCKISFAVGNAPDSVKKHAKWRLDKTCDEGAVAEALELTYGLGEVQLKEPPRL